MGEKAYQAIHTMVRALFVIVMLCVLAVCLVFNQVEYAGKKNFAYSNLVYLAAGSILLGLGLLCACLISRRKAVEAYGNRIMLAVSLLYGLVLAVLCYHYYFKTGWDVATVVETARFIADGQPEWIPHSYFSQYPNNVLLTCIYAGIIRLGRLAGIGNHYFLLIVFQCVIFAYAGYLVYRIAAMIMGSITYACLTWLLYMGLVGLSPWVVVPYSDATGLFFPVTILYLYLQLRKKGGGRRTAVCLCAMGFLGVMGYLVKPQTLIAVIAVIILSVFENVGRHRPGWIRKGVYAVMGAAIGAVLLQGCIRFSGIVLDKERAFGISHFLMMGINEQRNGVYLSEDVHYSASFPTGEERREANLAEWKRRLQAYGPSGVARILHKKLLTNFNDGTFAWDVEGSFFSEVPPSGNLRLRGMLMSYYYPGGKRYSWFFNIAQTFWITCLFFSLPAVWAGRRREGLPVLMLSAAGLFFFEMLFEAKARYLLCYTPFFVLLAGLGWRETVNLLRRLFQRTCKIGHKKDQAIGQMTVPPHDFGHAEQDRTGKEQKHRQGLGQGVSAEGVH